MKRQKPQEELAFRQIEDLEAALVTIEEEDAASDSCNIKHSASECCNAEDAAKQEEVLKYFHNRLSSRIHKEKPSFWKKSETCVKGQILARNLYHHKEFRSREIVWKLRNDAALAEETAKAYVTYFKFEFMSIDDALRSFLKVFWPEDELDLQHLLLNHFSKQYVVCNELQRDFQPGVYYVTWAMIMLNADLHAGHKGKKMTCCEFLMNLMRASQVQHEYDPIQIMEIYDSIEMNMLEVFRIKTRIQDSFESENNDAAKVHKTGHLICKQIMDKNGRKTRMGRRSWKHFTAVLKDLVLQLQKDSNKDKEINIRLHHALAYPLKHKNIPHVLCVKVADSSIFYFQAESEEEQTSWVEAINQTVARYSAPMLTATSYDIEEHCPYVLPTFPSRLSLEQQFKYTQDQLQKVSKHLMYYMTLPDRKSTLPADYMEQEVIRYTTYVRALQKRIEEKDPEEQ